MARMGSRGSLAFAFLVLLLSNPVGTANPIYYTLHGYGAQHPVILIHGFDATVFHCGGTDVGDGWRTMVDSLLDPSEPYRFIPGKIHITSYYGCETNSVPNENVASVNDHGIVAGDLGHNHHFGLASNAHARDWDGRIIHTQDTPIEHLAYHHAWYISHHFPNEPVDIVAHSMGGLIARYMVLALQNHDPEFPQDVSVEDVVTWGAPFAGAFFASTCTRLTGLTQCEEMTPGSAFLTKLNAAGVPRTDDPVKGTHTQWAVIGSQSDWVVPADSAVHMPWVTALLWDDGLGHSDFRHSADKSLQYEDHRVRKRVCYSEANPSQFGGYTPFSVVYFTRNFLLSGYSTFAAPSEYCPPA